MLLLRESRAQGGMALAALYRWKHWHLSTCSTKAPFSCGTKSGVIFRQPRVLNEHQMKARHEPDGFPIPLYGDLQARGFIENIAGDKQGFRELLDGKKTAAYAGIDPTADALHVGNLMVIMPLFHMYLHGHRAITVLGTATAMVGDPSGRTTERETRKETRLETVARADSMKAAIKRLWNAGELHARARGYNLDNVGRRDLMENREWMKQVSIYEFFAVVGKFARIGTMMARDSVKIRMESGEGMSYGEFSYSLLQAYDFWQLYNQKLCRIQIGGSDQWGNITAGLDLIRKQIIEYGGVSKNQHEEAFGMTVPLLVTASGEKFGKSAGNAVWLTKQKTSPFELYQFFVRTEDVNVEKYLKYFTLIKVRDVEGILAQHAEAPEKRYAQHKLAYEVVAFCHGEFDAKAAETQSKLLFSAPGESLKLEPGDLKKHFSSSQDIYMRLPKEGVIGNLISKVAHAADLADTRTAVNHLIKGGGLYVGINGKKVPDPVAVVTEDMLTDDQILVLRAGKGTIRMVELTPPDFDYDEAAAKTIMQKREKSNGKARKPPVPQNEVKIRIPNRAPKKT